MSFADEYNRLVMKYARLDQSQVHPDWHPTGISPRVGHVLQLIANEEHKYPVSGEMATTALIFGPGIGDEHFERLGQELHNEGHPLAAVFAWGNVPGAVQFDKRVLEAIKPEWDRRFENPTPAEVDYRNHNPDIPLESRRYSNLMGLAGQLSHSANHADRIGRLLGLDNNNMGPEERGVLWTRILESLRRIGLHGEDTSEHLQDSESPHWKEAAESLGPDKLSDYAGAVTYYPTKYLF